MQHIVAALRRKWERLYTAARQHRIDFAIGCQKEWLLQYANDNGYSSLSWCIGNGESGATLNRQQCNALYPISAPVKPRQ